MRELLPYKVIGVKEVNPLKQGLRQDIICLIIDSASLC